MNEQTKVEEKPDIDKVIKALEEYHQTGQVQTVKCQRCGSNLQISPLGDSALRLSCSCGLYEDRLRGL